MFFSRLEACCRQMGIKPSALADEFHTTRSVISGWKHGASPNSEFVAIAAKYFSVSSDYLLGLTDDPRPAKKQVDMHSVDPALATGLLAASEIVRNSVLRIASTALKEISALSTSTPTNDPVFYSNREQVSTQSGKILKIEKGFQTIPTPSSAIKGIMGRAAAGPPITAVPGEDREILVPVKYMGERYFIVQAEGDSMTPQVKDGDFCVFDRQKIFEEGRVVLVQVDGQTDEPDATIKRVYRRPENKVELRSNNPRVLPMFYPADEVVIMGELVAVLPLKAAAPMER